MRVLLLLLLAGSECKTLNPC